MSVLFCTIRCRRQATNDTPLMKLLYLYIPSYVVRLYKYYQTTTFDLCNENACKTSRLAPDTSFTNDDDVGVDGSAFGGN